MPGRHYASLGTRCRAFLLDYILIALYLALLTGAAYWARPLLLPLFTHSAWTAELAGFLLITLPVGLYFALSEGSGSQATWGKRRMGIRVASIRGRPLGLGASLLRSAIKFAPWELAHFTIWRMVIPSRYPDAVLNGLLIAVYGLIIVYFISPLWSKRKQALYDYFAGTVVCSTIEPIPK